MTPVWRKSWRTENTAEGGASPSLRPRRVYTIMVCTMKRETGVDLGRLFSPRSIAVAGASSSPGKPGRLVLENLKGSTARLYAVHPRHRDVLAVPAFPDVAALPEVVDLLVVAVGAVQTVPIVRAARERGVPFVIALAGGFAEAGAEGCALQDELVRLLESVESTASRAPTRLLGPNTLGVQVPGSGLDTIFVEHATEALTPGGVAVISQSGSVAVEALGAAARHRFPLRAFAGLGNAIDLKSAEFIDFFSRDGETGTICVYLEHLGEGRPLLRAARDASRRLPVFFLKAGRTAAGAAAAASHTGRLAGSDRVVDGALRQFGIQRVRDDEALLDAARAVTFARIPRGNRVAIITPAGGYGVMGMDYIEATTGVGALQPAVLGDSTKKELARVCLPFAAIANPVDLTAGVDDESFDRAVRILLRDPGVDILLIMAFLAPAGLSEGLIGRIGRAVSESERSVLVFCRSGERTEEYCRAFTDAGVAAYDSLSRTIEAARVLVTRGEIEGKNGARGSAGEPDRTPVNRPGDFLATWLLQFSSGDGRQPTEADTKALLGAYGIAVPRSLLLSPENAPDPDSLHFATIPAPWAVKVVSPRILHKTEAGAVRLGVTRENLGEILRDLRARFPEEDILVEEMIRDISVEMIAGALRDPDLGPSLMLGAGGTLAELYRDVTFRLVPASPGDIGEMMKELALSPLLRGYRGIVADREALRECLLALSGLAEAMGDRLAELDVNPLVYAGDRWIALDAKVVLAPS